MGGLVAELRKTDSLRPYPRNPRKISDKAVAKVAASITEYGFRQPIVVDRVGRTCLAIEIAPAYVDIAVKRWQNFTGKQAALEATGEPFDGDHLGERRPSADAR